MVWAITEQTQVMPLAITITFTILPAIACALRVWARKIQKIPLRANDWTMLAALIWAWAVCACEYVNIFGGGIGLHQDYIASVDLPALFVFGKSMLAIQITWAVAQGLVKTSMCLLYMSIFSMKKFRMAAYTVMGISVAFAAMVIISTLAICEPLSLQWDPTVKGTCGNRNALWLWVGIINIITDALIVGLPMPMLWGLHLPQGKKLALLSIFGLGTFVCIVSMVRLNFLLAVDFAGDTTYSVVGATVWSLLEPTLGVTVGCLPVLGPVFNKLLPRGMSLGGTGARYGRSNGKGRTEDSDNFRRLDDHAYPLTAAGVSSNRERALKDSAIVETATRGSDSDSLERGEGGIHVKTEWVVSSK